MIVRHLYIHFSSSIDREKLAQKNKEIESKTGSDKERKRNDKEAMVHTFIVNN